MCVDGQVILSFDDRGRYSLTGMDPDGSTVPEWTWVGVEYPSTFTYPKSVKLDGQS